MPLLVRFKGNLGRFSRHRGRASDPQLAAAAQCPSLAPWWLIVGVGVVVAVWLPANFVNAVLLLEERGPGRDPRAQCALYPPRWVRDARRSLTTPTRKYALLTDNSVALSLEAVAG